MSARSRPRRSDVTLDRRVRLPSARDRARRPAVGRRSVAASARVPATATHARSHRGTGGLSRRRGRGLRTSAPRSRTGRQRRTPRPSISAASIAMPSARCWHARSTILTTGSRRAPSPYRRQPVLRAASRAAVDRDRIGRAIAPGVRDAVDRRLARLPAACVDSRHRRARRNRVRVDTSSGAASVSTLRPAHALEPAERTGLIVPIDQSRSRFIHDLVRETLVDGLGSEASRRHSGDRSRTARGAATVTPSEGMAVTARRTTPTRRGPSSPSDHVLASARRWPRADATRRCAAEEAAGHLARAVATRAGELAGMAGARTRARQCATARRCARRCARKRSSQSPRLRAR